MVLFVARFVVRFRRALVFGALVDAFELPGRRPGLARRAWDMISARWSAHRSTTQLAPRARTPAVSTAGCPQ
jgi:hypothetical protein